jgi:hypothetical protein
MEHFGRGLASIGLGVGVAFIAIATKEAGHASTAMVLGLAVIWWRSGR